jgi:hypothetical protein
MVQPTKTILHYAHGELTLWKLPNGDYHREDGPAVIYPDGTKYWYFNDKYHRLDGPAIELPDGEKRWFIHGIHFESKEDYVVFYEIAFLKEYSGE